MVRPKIRDYDYSPNHKHKPIESIRDFEYYTMYIVKSGEKEPKRLVFGETTWVSNIDTLGVELRTNLPKNIQDRFLRYYNVAEIGDMIIFKNLDHEIFRGMIFDITENRYSKEIVCYDSAFYLNKKQIIKQFSKVRADKAIQSVCKQVGFKVGSISRMYSAITKIYKNQTPADIIKDILEIEKQRTGNTHRFEVRGGKLYVERDTKLKIDLIHKPSANVSLFDPTLVQGEINRSDSIVDMKNKVVVVTEEKKKIITRATATDKESIRKYGEMTHIETIPKEERKNAQRIANNKLRELTGIKTNLTVELLGDDKARAGRVISLENPVFKLKGDYLIENCQQTLANNTRKMVLTLKGV